MILFALATVVLFLPPAHAPAWRLHGHAQNPHPMLVGYFPQWGLYYEQPYSVKQLVDNGGAALLGQIKLRSRICEQWQVLGRRSECGSQHYLFRRQQRERKAGQPGVAVSRLLSSA